MTAITEFYDALRVVLGDMDGEFPEFEDSALLMGVRATVRMGRIRGYQLSGDRMGITPDVSNPNVFALVVYHTARTFRASEPDRYSYGTRAIGETFGGYREFLFNLEQNIQELENGTFFGSYTHLGSWMKGMFGVNLWEAMTEVTVQAPFGTVNVSRAGIAVGVGGAIAGPDGSVLFTNVGALLAGAYLLGEYLATGNCELTTAVVNCAAGTGDCELTLEVNGRAAAVVAIEAGRTRVEAELGLTMGPGDSARWHCTGAPGSAPESVSAVSVNMTVRGR